MTPRCPRFTLPPRHGAARIILDLRFQRPIERATTPRAIERAIRRLEPRIARAHFGEDYLWCDEAAELMGQALACHGVRHRSMLGYSYEGSSHVWVRVGKTDYDPTRQGCLLREPGPGEWKLVSGRWRREGPPWR